MERKRWETQWRKNATKVSCMHSSNITTFTTRLQEPTLNAKSTLDFWDTIFTLEIITLWVEYTNTMIGMQKDKYAQSYRANYTGKCEIKSTYWFANAKLVHIIPADCTLLIYGNQTVLVWGYSG